MRAKNLCMLMIMAGVLCLAISTANAEVIIDDNVNGNNDDVADYAGSIETAWAGWGGNGTVDNNWYGLLDPAKDDDAGVGGPDDQLPLEALDGEFPYANNGATGIGVTYGGAVNVGTYTLTLQVCNWSNLAFPTVVNLTFGGMTASSSIAPEPASGDDEIWTFVFDAVADDVGNALTFQFDLEESPAGNIGIDHLIIDVASPFAVSDPDPENLATNVLTSVTLDWVAPSAYTPTGYNLYYRQDDPNFAATGTTEVPGLTDSSYDPDVDWPFDTTIYWRVDAIEDGSTVHTGSVWSFTTAPEIPVITVQPVSIARGSANEKPDAVLTIEAVNQTSLQWYKDGNALDGETSATLTITDVQLSDEGEYRCDAINFAGAVPSETVWLEYARKKLHLDFEDNITDQAEGYATTWMGEADVIYEVGEWTNLGKAARFNGDPNDYIDVDVDAMPVAGTEISVSMWTKHEGSIHATTVCEAMDGSEPGTRVLGTHLPWSSGTIYFDAGLGSGGPSRISKSMPYENLQDTWNHFVFTKDAEEGLMKIYYNGTLWQSGTGKTMNLAQAVSLVIGTDSVGNTVTGLIDDFRIYNYALDAEEAATMYFDVTGIAPCLYPPAYDYTDDCKVDLADFALFASQWLECGLIPASQCD